MKSYNDPHSYAEPGNAVVKHLNWDAEVSFKDKIINAVAKWTVEASDDARNIVFDTRDLNIKNVTLDNGKATEFELGEANDNLGRPLTVQLEPGTEHVNITYTTSPNAAALQWLSPEQTADKTNPFLFTQSQAILARTWLPCQDSPGIRFSYDATVKVPEGLLAIMSAENPTGTNPKGVYNLKMKQPIPAYLMALAVGKLDYARIGPTTGIYAEPSMVEASEYEFADMEKMVTAAEGLYGPYAWEQYDMIILPPSFPFGGMENPRLTFATPTIIAGDRSLTSLVAHELAHSWSGNLVTNATWNDFWLNEGFTVYFERRIMEALYGKKYAEMLAQLGYQDLQQTLNELKEEGKPKDTQLKLDLDNRDPDDGMTDVAYEKGYFLLRLIENTVGRDAFDQFLKQYFEEKKFHSMTTEQFVDYITAYFGDNKEFASVNLKEWIYEPGLPGNCPKPGSDKFEKVETTLADWKSGIPAKELKTSEWSTHEWLHFIRHLPEELSKKQLTDLDEAFGFTNSGNSEILAAWFIHTIRNNYDKADTAVDSFLVNVGRRKFLTPTYKALIKADPSKEKALAIYRKARSNYHAVSRETMDELLGYDDKG